MSELPADQYDLKVTCNDEAGNYAEKQTHFNLQLDNTPPIVTRVYRSGASLEIQTDEQATCAYDYNNCLFNFENGTKMDSAISLAHQANWKPGLTYYIKCKDIWGNYKNDCNIQVSPDVFGE